jgi:hypothetical protein
MSVGPPRDIPRSKEQHLSRRQYAFIVGFLFVWLAYVSGPIVVAALAAGVIAWLGVRALEGDLEFGEWLERFREGGTPSRRQESRR